MGGLKKWLYTTRGGGDDSRTAPGFPVPRWSVWIALGIGGIGSLAALGYGGYRWSAEWIERRNATRAQGFIAQKDYRRAHLLLEQAVQINPGSASARKALAEFYDLAGNPAALDRWREAVEIAPADDDLKLGWAGSALRVGNLPELRTALAGVTPAKQETLMFHRLAAGLALAEAHAPELATHLEAMVRLEPDNVRSRYSLASLKLGSPRAEEVAQGRTELELLARGTQVRIPATLALWRALPPRDAVALRRLALRLLPPGAVRSNEDGGFALVEHMKAQPHPAAEDVAALANWMSTQGLARESLLWLQVLAPEILAAPAVRTARAAAATQVRDWGLLSELLIDGAWGHAGKDVIERAFAARAEREKSNPVQARAVFGEALKLAADSPGALWLLARLCAVWEWPEAGERVFWQIVRAFPREENAWRGLITSAESEGNTEKLLGVLQQRALTRPGDAAAQADWLLLAVLAGRADAAALRRAQAAWAAPHALPAEIAAGALVLEREGRGREALAAFDRIADALRSSPRAGLVYGVLLAEAGRAEDAKRWLPASPATQLLPEERALLLRARGRPSEKG